MPLPLLEITSAGLRKYRQAELCEIKAGLVCIVSSRPAKATERDPASNKQISSAWVAGALGAEEAAGESPPSSSELSDLE